jgi:uncharacterized protein YndB with AHSA1/START domain
MLENGRARTVKTTFSRETSVDIHIAASPEIVWEILARAGDYPRWNPTIVSLSGEIAEGDTIRLKSTLDPKRTFKLKIKELNRPTKLVWGDGQGNRVFTITRNNGGSSFSMTEKIGGLLFPLYGGMIPSFDDSFELFAASLKKAAESK